MTPIGPAHHGIVRERRTIEVRPGLELDAELTLPADLAPGERRPAVVLVAGQGALDMDETVPGLYTADGKPARNFRQIADELTDAGCIVLRYTKPGALRAAADGTPNPDPKTWASTTRGDLVDGARSAVENVRSDPRVSTVSMLGHSEGSAIAGALVAAGVPLQAVVLMGVLAHDAGGLARIEARTQADSRWKDLGFSPEQNVPREQLPAELQASLPTLDTDGDGHLSRGELRSAYLRSSVDALADIRKGPQDELVEGYSRRYWVSAFDAPSNLDNFKTAPSRPSVLLWQGEDDSNTPFTTETAALYRQLSLDGFDVDMHHYPGLGHGLAPRRADGTPTMGPIAEAPLKDLRAWATSRLLASANPEPPPQDPALRQTLLDMMQADQDARRLSMQTPDDPSASQAVVDIDRKNGTRLKQLLDAGGWPGERAVGKQGAHAAWILAQHQDNDRPFQHRCLDLLQAAVDQHDARPTDLAYLVDRVRVAEGRPQVYGTQLQPGAHGYEPRPMEDPEHVEERRAALGMQSERDYLIDANIIFADAASTAPPA